MWLLLIISIFFTYIGFKELKPYKINSYLYFVLLFINIYFIYTNNYFLTMIFPILLSQILIDFKALELSDINNLCLFISGLMYMFIYSQFNIKTFLFLSIIYFILYCLPFTSLGFGDVKLIISLSLFYSYDKAILLIFYPFLIALGFGLFYKIFLNKNEFPMGPSIIIVAILLLI